MEWGFELHGGMSRGYTKDNLGEGWSIYSGYGCVGISIGTGNWFPYCGMRLFTGLYVDGSVGIGTQFGLYMQLNNKGSLEAQRLK